jgi:hypothetical protein
MFFHIQILFKYHPKDFDVILERNDRLSYRHRLYIDKMRASLVPKTADSDLRGFTKRPISENQVESSQPAM